MGFGNFQLSLASRAFIVICIVAILPASLQAREFPLGRSDLPVVLPYAYYGKDLSGGELSAIFDSKRSQGSMGLKSGGSSVEIMTSFRDQILTLSRRNQHFQYTFVFSKSTRSGRFDLVEVKRRSLGRLFYSSMGVDGGSFDTVVEATSAFVKPDNCMNAMAVSAQAHGLRDLVVSQESCAPYSQNLRVLTEAYAPEASLREDSPIACMDKIGADGNSGSYKLVANSLRGKLAVADSMKVRCDASVKSNFDENGDGGTLTIGHEIITGDLKERRHVFLHEMLHSAGIQDESEVNAITECCASPSRDANRCKLVDWFDRLNRAKARDTNGLEKHWPIVEELLRSNTLSASEKVAEADALRESFDKFVGATSSNSDDKIKKRDNFFQSAQKICSLINTSECGGYLAALAEKLGVQIDRNKESKKPGNYVNERVDVRAGTFPANPSANPQTPPQQTAPQALQYRAETTEPAAVRREVERIRQPLMAAREYGGSVARTIVSSMGNTAYAANSSLPRRVSKTEWTSAVKSVDPKTGRVTLDLGRDERGRQIVASASIPFDGSQFGPPQVSVQAENLPAISDRTTANRKLNASSSTRVDVSDSTYKSATEVGSSVPGRLPRGGGAAKTQSPNSVESGGVSGAGVSGLSLSSGGSSVASRGSSPSRSVADAPSVSASVLKRMLVRTESPDAIIRDHIEDLKANSMQVRYKCVWYPQNFKGTQLFDLDAYQGRKCGSQ